MSGRWREWARQLKREALAVYLAGRDRRVAWYAKLLALAVAAYAFSPIDLIPDFVPLLGYVDDLVIVPLGILLVIRMVPPAIMAEHRARAAAMAERPVSRAAAAVIVLVWVAVLALSAWVGLRLLARQPAGPPS